MKFDWAISFVFLLFFFMGYWWWEEEEEDSRGSWTGAGEG